MSKSSLIPYQSSRFWIISGVLVTLVFFGILALTTCSSTNNLTLVEETQEKQYQRGVRLLKEGRDQEALNAFLKVIEKRTDAPESHLEVGRLYLNYIGDPIAAIYHFRKYLEYCPLSEQAPMVRQLIDTARKQFARSLPGQPFQDEMERVDLLKLLEETREENAQLKRKLATAKKRFDDIQTMLGPQAAAKLAASFGQAASSSATSKTIASNNVSPQGNASKPRVTEYTVEAGDTLTKISQKVYGTSSRWQDIMAANGAILPSPNSLKPGQILTIPQ